LGLLGGVAVTGGEHRLRSGDAQLLIGGPPRGPQDLDGFLAPERTSRCVEGRAGYPGAFCAHGVRQARALTRCLASFALVLAAHARCGGRLRRGRFGALGLGLRVACVAVQLISARGALGVTLEARAAGVGLLQLLARPRERLAGALALLSDYVTLEKQPKNASLGRFIASTEAVGEPETFGLPGVFFSGRYWTRTSDFLLVRSPLGSITVRHCASKPENWSPARLGCGGM
jgi:hypothetical protein